ncbi:MAG TPA: metal-dependent hydrolase [Gemmatimonadales bacterium]|nr:metal-dependent hydrolase [Gemmatimonadales bacterium]
MFIGHYALGLAAKRIAPRTSLGPLIAAPTLADMLWPVFLLTGWERATPAPATNPFFNYTFDSYPISHSLLALALWAALFGGLYRWRTGYARGAVVVALLVLSHWVLDWVTHRPDMPLYPGGPKVGLGLWGSVLGTVTIESVMFAAGLGVYLAATRARDRVGRYAFWGFIAMLVASYVGSLFSPPPVMPALAIGGIVFGWLFVAWAWWADKHREALQDAKSLSR